MLKSIGILLAISAAGSLLWAADPAAPLPASFKSAAELAAELHQSMAKGGDQSTAPIVNESHYRVNIVHRDKPGPAMTHATGPGKGTEVHYILDGAATVVTGGALVRSAGDARAASRIDNGVERHVAKGDVVVIPAGTPHWYKEVDGSVTYFEVRFDVDLK